MSNPRELHQDLVAPGFAAQVVMVPLTFDVTETASVDVEAFVATRRMRLINASYVQESNATAATSYTCLLQNATGSVALCTALDIKTLANDSGADFAGITADNTSELADGDILNVVFTVTGGSVTAPDRVGIMLEFMMME
jgi:hypothetical protein